MAIFDTHPPLPSLRKDIIDIMKINLVYNHIMYLPRQRNIIRIAFEIEDEDIHM